MKVFVSILLLIVCSGLYGQQISLAGEWRFAIDREDVGIADKWFNKRLPETILLPGSMNQRGKGDDVTLSTKWTGSIYDSSFFFRRSLAKYRTPGNLKIPFWLTPDKYYVGRAWYQKEVIIPAAWKAKSVKLFLERVHITSRVWVDGNEIGVINSLAAPHEYDLGKLGPGRHTITIAIHNRINDMNVGPDSHSVSDHTQGNWNGIIGKMYLEAVQDVHIESVQVYPDIKKYRAKVVVYLANKGTKQEDVSVTVSAKSFNTKRIYSTIKTTETATSLPDSTTVVTLYLAVSDRMVVWDEFDPALYKLTVGLNANKKTTEKQYQFAMREFSIKGTQFYVNDKPVFLRGTLNNCEFPLTGYPSMEVADWERIFRTAKSHGLNHIRFHSWCPPEAAFIAADLAGFYLQPEAPTWPNHGTSVGDGKFIDQYIYAETGRILTTYGNYGSFCMMAAGNEPAGRNQAKYLADYVSFWKARDNRHVYTGASVAMSWPLVPGNEYMVKSGPRGLKWTNTEPENVSDFLSAIQDFDVPYVTHEMGQWCVFPDFSEIKRYTGAYKARNFELFEQDLADHGMSDQAVDFVKASGKLQALCYKAEIEKDLRTPGLAGFQLLGLQDFPGQGTALIGVLNAFWQEKGYITAKEFKRFCNATVPLIRARKFVFTDEENAVIDVNLFHYGKEDLKDAIVSYTFKDDSGRPVSTGSFDPKTYTVGTTQNAGNVIFSKDQLKKPGHYKLEVRVDGTDIANDWDFWMYPAKLPELSNDIYYCTSLDDKAEEVLKNGGKVFLDANGKVVKGKEIAIQFTPVFWNTSWFKMRPPHVLGLLIQNTHPAFADFPTSYHSDYQWWSIVTNAQVMHLEDFPKGFKPLVQPIDTWFMNRKLGLVIEAKVGNGKLIISSASISDTSSYPASRQLFYSLKKYMLSDQFNPKDEVQLSVIKDLFTKPSREIWDSFTKDSPDELKPIKNPDRVD